MEGPSARELAFATVGALVASAACTWTTTSKGSKMSTASVQPAISGINRGSDSERTILPQARAGAVKCKPVGPSRATRRWHLKHRRVPLGEPRYSSDRQLDHPSGRLADTSAPTCAVFELANCASTVRRTVICREALAWLEEQTVLEGHVIASLPDITEVDLEAWRRQQACDQPNPKRDSNNAGQNQTVTIYRNWYRDTVALILSRLAPRAVAIFYMSDGRHDGSWLDKSYIAQQAAEASECHLLFHKIALFDSDLAALSRTQGKGRPKYSHLLAFCHTACADESWFDAAGTPDIFARGEMDWARAMGDAACVTACALVRAADAAAATAASSREVQESTAGSTSRRSSTRRRPTVISLFAGRGSVLAVANEMGMDAIGVELSRKRCATALTLRLLKARDANKG